jgi:hypothetical protein
MKLEKQKLLYKLSIIEKMRKEEKKIWCKRLRVSKDKYKKYRMDNSHLKQYSKQEVNNYKLTNWS